MVSGLFFLKNAMLLPSVEFVFAVDPDPAVAATCNHLLLVDHARTHLLQPRRLRVPIDTLPATIHPEPYLAPPQPRS